jgi:hypothetical protein
MRAPISKKALDMLNDPKKAVELIEAIRRARAAQGEAQKVQIGWRGVFRRKCRLTRLGR